MENEVRRLEMLFNELLVPNETAHGLIDSVKDAGRKRLYLSILENLTDMETEILRLKYELTAEQASKDEVDSV